MIVPAAAATVSEVRELAHDLVALKHALGFSWGWQERLLRQFSDHCELVGLTSGRLTAEAVDGFLYGRGLKASTVTEHQRVLSELGGYARERGFEGAYVCETGKRPRRATPVPYVLADDEVRRFMDAVDGQVPTTRSNKSVVDPVLFRVLYGTGMRVSECLALTLADLGEGSSTLHVRHGKNGRDRVLPVTERLASTLSSYVAVTHPSGDREEHLFYAVDPRKGMCPSQVYARFRDYLLMADIPHFRSGGPKVHSFRHGFAVGNLRRWAIAGEDLTNRLPYLMAYMGHADLRSLEYYLRLTADLYPEVSAACGLRFGYVIPEGWEASK